jgi:hypothetical protein
MHPIRPLFLLAGALLLNAALAQDLSVPNWLTMEQPHNVSKVDYISRFGPFEHDGLVYLFEDVHHPMIGKEEGRFGYRFDPDVAQHALAKDLSLNIEEGKGRMVAVLEASDRFISVYYTMPDKNTVRIWAQAIAPVDLTPLGEAVQVAEIPFTDHYNTGFKPDVVLSPDHSRFLVFYDLVMDADRVPLMLCWVVNADLTVDWQATYKRPNYMSNMALFWSRKVLLDDGGTIWLPMRTMKESVKTYTSSTDPVKITEPKLARLHGERYDLIDLVVDGKTLEFPTSAVVGEGLEVAGAINTGTEKKPNYGYGLFKVTDTNTLDPVYREPITGEGLTQVGALHKEAGGWYGMYRTDAGLTVFDLNAQGTKEWTTSLPRYKDYWTRVFEWKGDLFLTNCAQESAINGYDKGKDFSSRDNAFQLIPSYLRIHGKDKHSLGAIYPAASGGERDVLNHGSPAFEEVPSCGWFMEPSRDSKRPGVVVVKIN